MALQDAKRIVCKVGTSTLTYPNGRLHIRRIEKLVRVLSDFKNSGKDVILVTSGAIGVGATRLGLDERPRDTRMMQAAAAVGQVELMYLYDKLFLSYGQVVAQILMTRILTDHDSTRQNLVNTFETLLSLGVIPVVNENDSVAVEELEEEAMAFGGNDTLSAVVAVLVQADALVLLSDIEGLFDKNPREAPDACLIPVVESVDERVRASAGGAGSTLGTGGMVTKLEAAEMVTKNGIDMVIMDGSDPEKLYALFDGKQVGTYFPANPKGERT
ncbi:glutamate 5-kinase [Ethanoligenens harbinense]|uniref:Glutamate 5-kinase n=1 Tax=Ethanoligenens harbinense (strain DSM 18485 / JCM 12961 / CGMCC 1.5033 / YUAN-3) TaxID=663278 RepID=E6U647_ETHHY|nr:glutamate 5-kinase [Ethanoligenens harbinense]ADU25726.1 glutamate 5-kinase [Ethanoligenens harbinense YUAN-3]AVQ97296.1 glutamate 5-kinase [Ethanoligenens harbinense YUAN-3]AYF39962.1 glutamate 5-kinase [Ethanoligenens harbinense]AYF42790.1 glutamate 5-kinase [Ethanoligenens harbinense]QCN93540.1 glutamate 5-kinase [Ethanoligenens harbinense]